MRARSGLPSFRRRRCFVALREAIRRGSKDWFRIVQFSVQEDHIHLMVEADDRTARIRGVQGLAVRCARAFNRAVGRRGKVWADRYHGHALTTPTETRAALVYILRNECKHTGAPPGIDECSSAPWFDGWQRPPPVPLQPSPVRAPETWLARVGWLRAGGPIRCDEAPAAARAAA